MIRFDLNDENKALQLLLSLRGFITKLLKNNESRDNIKKIENLIVQKRAKLFRSEKQTVQKTSFVTKNKEADFFEDNKSVDMLNGFVDRLKTFCVKKSYGGSKFCVVFTVMSRPQEPLYNGLS